MVLLLVGSGYAQENYTIHLIDFYDNVTTIQDGCKVDRDRFRNQIMQVCKKLNISLKIYNENNVFSFDKMNQVYPTLNVGSNDVLIFMYSGHGFHSTQQSKENPFPFMMFSQKDRQKYNILKVHESLMAKKARLTITFGDLCNSIMEGPSDDEITFNIPTQKLNNYRYLFSKAKGDFIATSSDVGQISYVRSNSEEGSYFAMNFHNVLAHILENPDKYPATEYNWEFVLSKTKELVIEQTEYAYRQGYLRENIQVPIYRINMSYLP